MKNQYFGDINDYKKYGLIRQLTNFGKISSAVCWMLTPNDLRPDGHRIYYLLDPAKWRKFDPVVYDRLREQVIEHRKRSIHSIEDKSILPNCKFFSEIVPDDGNARIAFLSKFLEFAGNAKLIFSDPDNGMEIKSVPFGRKRCSKYLYFSEVEKGFAAGHSLLVYQHLPPRPRQLLIRDLAERFSAVTGVSRLYLYWTQFVVFFLIPQSAHKELFSEANKRIAQTWGEEIKVEEYLVPTE